MPKLSRQQVARALDTENLEVGQQKPRKLSSAGPAKLDGSQLVEEVGGGPVDETWAEMMRFNEDPITFMLLPDAAKNAEDPVYCACNGDMAPVQPHRGWIYRGKEYTVPRKYIEALLRAKLINYTQRKEIDPNGIQQIINVPSVACRYQLRIINDPHPRGNEWIKHIMAEAP